MRKIPYLFFCLFLFGKVSGQQVRFRAVWGGEDIRWGTVEYNSAVSGKIRFSDLSFYISEISWFAGQGKAVHEHQRVELLMAGNETDSMVVSAPFRPERICFRFGLDSATQVSGRTNGALDPALGMYWAWNTGYIQCRLEGYSPDSKGKKGKFEFHLGGYTMPFPTDHKMCLDLAPNGTEPEVLLDLKPLMDAVPLKKTWSVLTPGEDAQRLTYVLAQSFRSAGKK